jgi:(p)ppGpp synthase/HD superfamily hydrolase
MALNVSKEKFVWNFMFKNNLEIFKKAYLYAQKCHEGHRRKDETPYFGHPNEVCYIMILLGITDEQWLSVAICHDVVEELYFKDGILLTKKELARTIGCSVAEDVYALTNLTKGAPADKRFELIEKKVELVIIKTIDRFVNMRSSMFDIFALERMERYVLETEAYILPMSERIINSGLFPQYENVLRILRSSIKGLLEGARSYIRLRKIINYKYFLRKILRGVNYYRKNIYHWTQCFLKNFLKNFKRLG